ncbi:MAG: hypothetical protein BWZ01_00805 [Deltaproteobacteria bacterium ADurb.BinA179]|jgi:hypothetical protein|nr:DUF2795 domain-containing protein [Deltaproteobacteria bacterium]MDI9542194.1 DUF2795 domain-containing protein [Pseudomonadota bacterium]NLW68437.1 DUF2795 domain-containing protein [Bacteriovoracaceae bacterium]OPZ29148.1 MAG: hypothetical protein BWZ01_00805 [Deltaproteobacteria bacterium ADurb.BinA179]HRR70508.1 DUF2795 domain-containing protein [Desulfomonilia bacterium]
MVSPTEVLQYLTGIDFPARKKDLLKKAHDNRAPRNIIGVLERLPDQVFRSVSEVNIAVGDIE